MPTATASAAQYTSRRRRALIFAVAFAVTLVYALWRALPQGDATDIYGMAAGASIDTLLPTLGLTDSGSYLRAAVDLQDGSISDANRWVLNLWPPAMPYLLAAIVTIGGGASPVIPMVVLVSVLWSLTMACVAVILIPRGGYLTTGLFAIIWLLSPMFTGWTIQRGVLGSDGLATALGALVTIGLIWASRSPTTGRARYLLYSALGAGLAALAYLRIMWFYVVPTALAVLALVVVVRIVILAIRRKTAAIARERRSYREWGALGATFVVLCAPWTIYAGTTLHPGDFSWSTGDYQWAQLWMPTARLNAIGGNFLVSGGGNWPCELAPVKCAEFSQAESATASPYGGVEGKTFAQFRQEALTVALTQPGDFIVDRSEVTFRTWLSVPGEGVGSFRNIGFGMATLLAFLAATGILIAQSIKQRAAPFFLLLVLGANIAVVWLTHFETRYLIPVQAISLIVVAFSITTLENRVRTRRSALARRRANAHAPARAHART